MSQTGIQLSAFKECDLRGELGSEITEDLAYKLGRAIGSRIAEKKIVLGGDFRLSTPSLMAAVRRGLVESGVLVYDLGQLSTPAYYFARRKLGVLAGVMVTASHSPAGWNGFKPVLGKFPITPEELEQIKELVISEHFAAGQGRVQSVDIKAEYVGWLAERFGGLGERIGHVVFDCGNGATGWVLEDVIKALKLKTTVLFPEPDGRFPNRSPDIAGHADLAALQTAVKQHKAQLGFGFDGDGDRVGVVDETGNRVLSDQLIAWLAGQLVMKAGGGAVIYDLKLSRLVQEMVEKNGGQAIAQKSGHTFIKTSMLHHNAVMGGEYSGHLFYRELEGGDDGLFSALLIASLVAESGTSLSEMIRQMPIYYSTPDIRIRYLGEKTALIEQAAAHAQQDGARVVRVDGVKAEYPEGWALVRASVTEPALTFRFEGSTRDAMVAVAEKFVKGIGDLGEMVVAQVKQHSAKIN